MAKKQSKKIDVPTESIEILAGYKDKEDNVHTTLEIREITGADEEAIAKADIRTNVGKVVTTLLTGCVTRVGSLERDSLSPSKWEAIFREMYLGDRDFILLKISEVTNGPEMSFNSRCPSCRKELTIEFNIDELVVEPLKGDPESIPFELPRGFFDDSGDRIKNGIMRLPNGFDQEQLDPVARKNPGTANTMLITRCVKELGDIKLSSATFRALGSKDREYLVKTLAENSFGPKFTIDAICDSCGNDFEAGVNPINFI